MVYIYGLFDPRNLELRYIGKTKNIKKRLKSHVEFSKRKSEKVLYSQRWIRQLLSEGLEPAIEILEECTEDNWQEAERDWIAECRKFGVKLTNTARGGLGGIGFFLNEEQKAKRLQSIKNLTGTKRTEEQKERMRLSHLGKPVPDETKRKLSEAHKGKNTWSKGKELSPETIEKMRIALKGKKMSEEQRLKLSESRKGENNPMFGKTRSEETRKKASISLRGRIVTDEHRAKLSQSLKGHIVSDETREKFSKALKGRKLSEETRQKMSIAQRQRRARDKNESR